MIIRDNIDHHQNKHLHVLRDGAAPTLFRDKWNSCVQFVGKERRSSSVVLCAFWDLKNNNRVTFVFA